MTFTDDTEARASYTGAGKVAVLTMVAIALVAATFAWWWNFNRGRQAMAFFGPRAANLIRTAPMVEILVIGGPESAGGPGSTDDKIKLNNFTYSVFKRIDISKAPGLIHARTSLLADSSYAKEPSKSKYHTHTEIVRFADDSGEAYIAITEPDGCVSDMTQGKSIPLIKKTADGWRQFLARNHPLPTPPAPARTDPSE